MGNTPASRRLNVAVVGCGQIADAHLGELAKVPTARVAAVCDTRPELAEQAAARFGVPEPTTDVDALLSRPDVDVLHLCTPVHTHAPLAIRCLEAGKHVYVEKPFTVDPAEADRVRDAARAASTSICLGHDQLFDPLWLRAMGLVDSGTIGTVRHVESHLGYSLSGPFAREVAADPDHWVRRLPGGTFQNTISHPIYRITEFVRGSRPQVSAVWLENGNPFPADLRVNLWDDDVTGSLLFTSRTEPQARTTRLYGERGILELDFDGQVIRKTRPASTRGVFEKLERPARQTGEAIGNLARNLWRFARGDIHYFHGMRNLFAAFYDSILDNTAPPISVDEMVRVTDIMDRIFEDCRENERRDRGSRPAIAGRPTTPTGLLTTAPSTTSVPG